MKEHQKEYEAYMKQVTDSFIDMQSETTTQEHLKDVMSQMLIVEWAGGLSWKAIRSEEVFRDGNLMEENRQSNAKIAKKYLQANTLTYDEWISKYKTLNNKIVNKKLYKEISDGELVSIERHTNPIFMSKLEEATEEEINTARVYFNKHGKCNYNHLVYDEDGFMYYSRYCGICGEFIDFI